MTHSELVAALRKFPLFPKSIIDYAVDISNALDDEKREELLKTLTDVYPEYEFLNQKQHEAKDAAISSCHKTQERCLRYGVERDTGRGLRGLQSSLSA